MPNTPLFNCLRRPVALKSHCLAIVCVLLLTITACSQTAKRDETRPLVPGLNPNQEAVVEREKQKLLARDTDADFTRLRQAYTSTPAYKPWDTREHEASLAMFNALQDGDYPLCLQFAEAMLELNYTSLGGHFGAFSCHSALGNNEQSAYHRYVISGLMHSIEQSGDGLSAETAYKTISASEMRSFLQIRGQLMYRQEYEPLGAKQINKIYAIDSETEEHVEVYFDNSAALFQGIKPHLNSR